MLENPVSFSFDDRGRCYVAETHRWSQSIFDITKNPAWLLEAATHEYRSMGRII